MLPIDNKLRFARSLRRVRPQARIQVEKQLNKIKVRNIKLQTSHGSAFTSSCIKRLLKGRIGDCRLVQFFKLPVVDVYTYLSTGAVSVLPVVNHAEREQPAAVLNVAPNVPCLAGRLMNKL